MSSYFSGDDDYSKYSAFEEGQAGTTITDSTMFVIQSKAAAGSLSLADSKFDSHPVENDKHQTEYSRDEFLYALSSPSSLGAIGWMISSFFAVIYGSSIVVYLNFFIPLLVGPYVIKEQMPAQLLSSVQRKFDKIQSETGALATVNLQLKSIVSRMQRQEYRLSAAEERFEQLCQRSEKDIVKMKQLARKNAALGQKFMVNLAGRKLKELMKEILSVNHNGKRSISQEEIHKFVMTMKDFAGKNPSSNFDEDVVQRAVVNSIVTNLKLAYISDLEPHVETREYDGDYDEKNGDSINEDGRLFRNNGETEDSSYSTMNKLGRLHDEMTEDDTRGEDSWTIPEHYDNHQNLKMDPSGHLQEGRHAKEGFYDLKQRNATSGTVDMPIDIEKLLFKKKIPNPQNRHGKSRYYRSESSEIVSMVSSVE